MTPQEGIALLLQANRRWDRRGRLGARQPDLINPPAQTIIPRFDGERKAQVGLGILVRAVNRRFVRQRRQASQRSKHLLGRTFENTAAPPAKEGIATKKAACAIIRQVSAGVPR